jgi:hypothetical protein
MVEQVESLSLVLWGVFSLAAGMYPLGLMLGAPCSPCCDSNAGCEPLFHRCLRELSVNGSVPAKALYVPSLEIFTHAEAALVKASEKAVVSVTITIPSLAAVHLNPGEQLVYSAGLTLSMGSEQWTSVIPDDAKSTTITLTLVGRAIDQSSEAYQAVVPAVVSGARVTAYASLDSQTISVPGIEIDLTNTLSSSCTTTTCFTVVNKAGLVKLSGRERSARPEYYRPAITGSIVDLALDKWVVNGTVMLDGFQLRELDFDKAEQFRNGEISLRKQRQFLKYVPADPATGGFGKYVEVTDYVDVKLAEYSPLCAMPLCYSNGVKTTIPDDLLPTGVTYTPADGEKYNCKDGYEFVLGNQASGCTYSHTTNECNGVVSKTISLLEFWKQYSLDPATNGRGTYCTPDILTWMEYQPQPLVKYGATYTVGGTYDPTKGRYGKCLNGGVTYLPDINGTCHPAEISIDIDQFSDPIFYYAGRINQNSVATSFVSDRLSKFTGTHVLAPFKQSDCTGMEYVTVSLGTAVDDVDPYGRSRTRTDSIRLDLLYHIKHTNQGGGGGFVGLGCDRNSSWDYLTIGGLLHVSRQARADEFPVSVNGNVLGVYSCQYGGNVPDYWVDSYYTAFPGFRVGCSFFGQNGYWSVSGREAGYASDGASYYSLYSTSTASKSDGSAMPSCSGVSYSPAEFTIDNTSLVDRRVFDGVYSYIWGNTPGATLTATTSPTGNYQLCGGAATTFGPFNNDRSQDRVYTRYAYSDGSSPTPITITVKGTCIAYPVGLFVFRSYVPSTTGFGNDYYTISYYGLWFGVNLYPQDYMLGGCVMVPIKTNGTECKWSVTSNNDWLTFAKNTDTGTGDGRVNVLISALSSNNYEREGSFSLLCNGKTTIIKVRQGGSRFG